ncbi:MAG: hypothetical protein QQN63_14565, partial [Nitrosopumilus sp.]
MAKGTRNYESSPQKVHDSCISSLQECGFIIGENKSMSIIAYSSGRLRTWFVDIRVNIHQNKENITVEAES